MMNGKNCNKLLNRLRELNFALLETNLYLDGHPNNRKALEYYKKVKAARDIAYEDYVKNCGPMFAVDVRQDYWSWINDPWPWQTEGEGD